MAKKIRKNEKILSEAWGLGDLGTRKIPSFKGLRNFFMPSYQAPQASPALGHLCKNPTCENIEKTTLFGKSLSKIQQNKFCLRLEDLGTWGLKIPSFSWVFTKMS